MRARLRPLLLPFASLIAACTAPRPVDPALRARELAREFVILDGHVDVPYRLLEQKHAGKPLDDVGVHTAGGDFDFPRAVEGGLDAPFFSIFTPAEDEEHGTSKQVAEELIDLVEGIVQAHPDEFTIARTAGEVRRAQGEHRLALLLGMENGSPIEGQLANVDHFFERGVRYLTLTHGKDNHICDSSYDERHTHKGLTPFGREVVRRMNELGILVDVSHISDDTFWQVMELTQAPAIASHSSLRHFVPGFERNMSDDMLRALAKNGGVIQINFGSSFLTRPANEQGTARRKAQTEFLAEKGATEDSPEATAFMAEWDRAHPFPFADVKDVADHIDHAVEIAGEDHVGLGSDFDGVGDSLPTGLKDVSQYPNLIAELLRRGYSESAIRKICGENVLRVLEEAAVVAQRLRHAG